MNEKKGILKDPRIALVIAPILLFSPVLFTGKALFWGTPAAQFIPWWNFAWKSLLSGQLPLWNPWVGMGAPLAANYQSALFYPPTWINFVGYLVGGIQWMAWISTALVCGHLIWAGFGTARFLRKLGINRLGQTIGGLAFGLSGYLVARAGFLSINAAAAWIPWLLVGVYDLAHGQKRSLIRLIFFLSMLLLAGHAQTAFYGIILGGAWCFYWGWILGKDKNRIINIGKVFTGYAGAGLWAAAISAIQLLPTAEYLLQSQRAVEYGAETAMTYSFWPWRVLTFLMPELYGNPALGNYWGYGNFWEDSVYIGLLPLLLALGYLINSFSKKQISDTTTVQKELPGIGLFLGGLIAISFTIALGKNTTVFPWLYKNIPGADLFQAPTRFSILALISLAILAGFGVNQLSKPSGRSRYFLRLAVAGWIAILIGAVVARTALADLKGTFFEAAAWLGLIGLLSTLIILLLPESKDSNRRKVWNFAIITLISLDLIRAGWGLNPGIDLDYYQILEREDRSRVWMPAEVEYELKFNRFFRFDTFLPANDWRDMHRVLLPNLAMLQEIQMVNNFDPFVPGIFQDWMDEFNGMEVDPPILQMMNIGWTIELDEEDLVRINEIESDIAPVRITGCAGVVTPAEASPEAILANAADRLADIVVVSTSGVRCSEGSSGTVEILQQTNGHLKAAVDLDQDGWVFWSQTWYPGWKIKVDGELLGPSYRVNYLFQGAPVAKDANEVEFIYQPGSYLAGGVVTAVSLLGWVGLFLKENGFWRKFLASRP